MKPAGGDQMRAGLSLTDDEVVRVARVTSVLATIEAAVGPAELDSGGSGS